MSFDWICAPDSRRQILGLIFADFVDRLVVLYRFGLVAALGVFRRWTSCLPTLSYFWLSNSVSGIRNPSCQLMGIGLLSSRGVLGASWREIVA